MTELEASGVGDHPPPYMIFVVVFLFFLTGLLGFLICHLLKKKGYRCRTGDMDDEEDEVEKLGGNADDEDEENQDTVEQILKCIIENEANMEAFNEMFGGHNVCVRHDPRLRKESIGGVPPHHHTVHSGTEHNTCHLCAQVRSKKGRRQSRTPRSKQRPGEQTVFSVGRFRVTHTDKKLHGGPNPLAISGDQLDQSQDSEERKEGGYNLRSMFKDVRPSSDSANGVAPNVGKRRKSVTIFGLRRGSDPVGIKVVEATGREAGGIKFAIQQQPVVLEELSQTENADVAPQHRTQRGSKPETTPSKNQIPAPLQHEAKTAGPVNIPHSQSKKPDRDSSSALADDSKQRLTPEPHTNQMTGSSATSAPSVLPLPSATSSQQTFMPMGEKVNVEEEVLKNAEAYDPGPLQTSTPIVPVPGSNPGFTNIVPSSQPEASSGAVFRVIQTPPEPSSSPELEPAFGASLALISLGSSPLSSHPIKTPSSTSSLKTPTSPREVTTSPGLSTGNTPSEGQAVSGQTPKTEEKMEIERIEIRTVAELSPVEGGFAGSALPSPSDQLSKDRLHSLPLSPSSPMGSRISSMTIVKASPDSKREFSVVTMVEDVASPTLAKAEMIPTIGQGGERVSVSGIGEHKAEGGDACAAEVRPTLSQEKDDMMEMEDIRGCKVMQVQEAERVEEEAEGRATAQLKQD